MHERVQYSHVLEARGYRYGTSGTSRAHCQLMAYFAWGLFTTNYEPTMLLRPNTIEYK